ncbi:uncharacterized protein RBU57_016138 [Macrochelys suwanniensis]
MAACTYMVHHARLRMRPLQLWLASQFSQARDGLDKVLTVPSLVVASLQWWSYLHTMLQGVPFGKVSPLLDLVSDMSDLGWGAHIGNMQTQGRWLVSDLSLHINVRALRAIHLACVAFSTYLRRKVVRVLMDNTTMMYYINRQGGSHSLALCLEALSLWEFTIAQDVSLQAFHLPGACSVRADRLSRIFSHQYERSLHSEVTHQLFQDWGVPQVDLFATRQNRHCVQFCSMGGMGRGAIADAFLLQGSGQLFYAFPPFPLIDKVLQKVKTQDVCHPHSPRLGPPTLVRDAPAPVSGPPHGGCGFARTSSPRTGAASSIPT